MAIFKRKTVKNDVELTADLLSAMLNVGEITKTQALSLPAVAEAVDKIANTVAMIPVKLYTEKEVDGKMVVEEVDDNRVSLLNEDTNSELDGYQFKKAIITDYLMGQGGYAYIRRRRNEFTGLFYVKEEDVAFSLIDPNPLHYKYQILVWGGVYEPYEYLKVLRNTRNGMYGEGVSAQVATALNTALQTMLLQRNLAKTGGNKRGYIQSERVLDKASITELKQAWAELYANNDTQNIPVLNKDIKFQESGATSTELQLNESKKQLNEEIAKIFHINGTYEDFIREAVQPALTAFETALNRDFLLEKEKKSYFFAFDKSEITKASIKERYEAYKLALESGWITPNEVRYAENKDAINGLDTINVGLGSVLYEIKKGEYFVPNTNSVYKVGENNGQKTPESATNV